MRMIWMRTVKMTALALLVGAMGACGGGGGGTAATTAGTGGGAANVSLSGFVVDGKVKSATLTIYSDKAMTQQIGTGTTDATGAFTITLTVATAPDPIYIKSTGGTNIDTGLPAPTMTFVGNTAGANKLTTFNITPLTTNVFNRVTNGTPLNTAQSNAMTAAGLNSATGANGLYADPTAQGNTTLKTATTKQLSSGTLTTSLPAGSYTLHMFRLSEADLITGAGTVNSTVTGVTNLITNFHQTRTLTIAANGAITGTGITGQVQGPNVVLEETNAGTTFRMAGVLGLNGSISGNTRTYSGNTETKGVFIGAFVPAAGTNKAAMDTLMQGLVGGAHLLSTSLFTTPGFNAAGGNTVPRITTGTMATVTYTPATGALSGGQMTAKLDQGTANGTALMNAPVFACNDGQMVMDANNQPTGIMILHNYLDTTPNAVFNQANCNVATTANQANPKIDHLFSISVVGLRRAVGLAVPHFIPATAMANTTGGIADIAISYIASTQADAVMPGLPKANTAHDLWIARVGKDVIGKSRTTALTAVKLAKSTYTTPALTAAAGSVIAGNQLLAIQGSTLAIKQDTTNTFSANNAAFLRLMQMFATGALQGVNVRGGTVGGVMNLTNPDEFVGFMHDPTVTAMPSITGTRNFLSWQLYGATVANTAVSGYSFGTVNVTKAPTTAATGAATMTVSNVTGAGTTNSTLTLTIDKLQGATDGIYHMHGAWTAFNAYVDIYWAMGGTRAVWMLSNYANANGTGALTVNAVGEAFLTL